MSEQYEMITQLPCETHPCAMIILNLDQKMFRGTFVHCKITFIRVATLQLIPNSLCFPVLLPFSLCFLSTKNKYFKFVNSLHYPHSHPFLSKWTIKAWIDLLQHPLNNLQNKESKVHRQDPGTTQPEGNFIHLNYKFFFFLTLKNFPVLVVNSLCKNIFLIFFSKFPVFSLSGKMDFQNPCFPCAVATLFIPDMLKLISLNKFLISFCFRCCVQ